MRRLALVALLLLPACAGSGGAAPASDTAPAPAPDTAPASPDPDTAPDTPDAGGATVDGSSGAAPAPAPSGEILCPEPSPGTLPEPGCEPAPEPEAAELVTPRPGMAGARPIPWTGAEPVGDGATLRITWISGVEPCSVLDRVELAETATEVRVTLVEGSDPGSPDAVCIELGVPKAVEVPLASPLAGRTVVDGAA